MKQRIIAGGMKFYSTVDTFCTMGVDMEQADTESIHSSVLAREGEIRRTMPLRKYRTRQRFHIRFASALVALALS